MLNQNRIRRLWMLLAFQIVLVCAVWSLSAARIEAQSTATPGNAGAAGQTTDPGKPILDIPNIHKQPFFWTVMVASVLGWILGMVKGFDSSKDWLAKYLKKVPMFLLFCTDLLIFVVIGAYVGTGLYQPTTFSAALAAGLTWPVALGALASKSTPTGTPHTPDTQTRAMPAANVPDAPPART